MLQKIEETQKQFASDVLNVTDQKSLEELRLKYMGKKGLVTMLMPMLKDVPNEQKREMGMKINAVKNEIEAKLTELNTTLEQQKMNAELFNAGFFKYSREDGTAAARLDGQIPTGVKTARLKKLYSVQKKIVKENNKALVGKTFKVLAEGFDQYQTVYYGRAYFNAPDVDGKIYFFSDEEVEYGEYINVKIIKATGYDLYGERV